MVIKKQMINVKLSIKLYLAYGELMGLNTGVEHSLLTIINSRDYHITRRMSWKLPSREKCLNIILRVGCFPGPATQKQM